MSGKARARRVCVERLGRGGIVPVGVAVGANVFGVAVGAKVFPSIVGARVVGDAVGGTVAQVTLSRSVPAWELS